jgi:hypothetical protein
MAATNAKIDYLRGGFYIELFEVWLKTSRLFLHLFFL